MIQGIMSLAAAKLPENLDELRVFAASLQAEAQIYKDELYAKTLHIEKLKELGIDDFFKIKDILNKEIAVFEVSVKKHADEACELIEKNNIPISSLSLGERGIGKYFKNLIISSVINCIKCFDG